ncbi:MAG: MFS transporter [Runella slithyformis]|jgi:MFS transporter, DHA1 family, tetracycline resistance protein|nr:MAG: MFS transporter [Runella slithyformis]TAF29301.1 MAG: MFS transporter [Runella slithyformis]TAF48318.1 MAG: MFS transporter [Runella slithyformis]TAF78719.1 MAG: MFS transporter [Runella slithyformis]
MKGKQTHALVFIFITLLIDVIGIGIIVPILPQLIQELTGGDLSQASRYGGLLMFAYAFMQFLFSPILGGLSDQYGRRPILLASLFGFGIDYLFLGFAPTIFWLFIGRLIAGITGASFTTAGAYIADVSPPEKRAQNFGLIGMAFGVGFIIGPVLGGLLGHYGPRVPFFVSAGLTLVNWLYGYFVLPESLKLENRRPFDWKRANPLGSLRQLQKYPAVMGLVASLFFIYVAGHATQGIWSYYVMEKFGWNQDLVGYSLGFVGLMVAIVQGGLTRVLIPKLGQQRAVFVGLSFYALGFVLFAFASQGWMMYAFMIPYSLGGLAGPSLQAIISGYVPPNEQGELQGALTSLVSITSIVGPLFMTNLFAYFTSDAAPFQFPGAAFIAGAVFTLVSLALSIRPLTTNK